MIKPRLIGPLEIFSYAKRTRLIESTGEDAMGGTPPVDDVEEMIFRAAPNLNGAAPDNAVQATDDRSPDEDKNDRDRQKGA